MPSATGLMAACRRDTPVGVKNVSTSSRFSMSTRPSKRAPDVGYPCRAGSARPVHHTSGGSSSRESWYVSAPCESVVATGFERPISAQF